MIVIDLISELWSKGEEVQRIDFEHYLEKSKNLRCSTFVCEHKSAPGVKPLLEKLRGVHEDYKEQIASIIDRETANEEKRFLSWRCFHIGKIICKRCLILSLLFVIVSLVLMIVNEDTYGNIFSISILFPFLLTFLSVIFKITEKICKVIYTRFSKKILNELQIIENSYSKTKAEYVEEMDTLCMESLSPLERSEERHRRELAEIRNENKKLQKEIKNMRSDVRNISKKSYETKQKVDEIYEGFGFNKNK